MIQAKDDGASNQGRFEKVDSSGHANTLISVREEKSRELHDAKSIVQQHFSIFLPD